MEVAASVTPCRQGAGPTVLALTTDGTLPTGVDLHGFTLVPLSVDPRGVVVEAG